MAGSADQFPEPPAPTEEPVFQPVSLAEAPVATPAPLTEGEISTTLRDLVCWYADPDLARDCLPAGEEFVAVLQRVALSGDERFVVPLVDMLWLEIGWERWVREALELMTGQRHATALEWYEWVQAESLPLPDGYADWKGSLLSLIDPLFARLIGEQTSESGPGPEDLVWALLGVAQVPPLVAPETVHRVEERYLSRSDIVYGVVIDGIAHAYPERIVAWHGVVTDEVDGVPLMVWHCTSCGGAAVFGVTASDGRAYTFAPAGLVWEGRRLFFDDETGSLWDAVSGRAVAGPATGARVPVRLAVRTTWGDWSDRYRNTRVLSLDTGFVRDYSEGAAIRADTESERPIFPIPATDDRLPMRTRVIGLTLDGVTRAYPLDRVEANGIVHDAIGGRRIAMISAGPGRGVTVFDVGGTTITALEGPAEDREVVDSDGLRWFMDEERLLNTRNSRTAPAVPYQVAYWFAWAGAYPDTEVWR
ncbi:MAG: DUF3179 domain-containing (seleno)protein [Chloroflexi bacterium]|nr:DUF3179 domain-containing (seleno)protein [Chloroflexota bacterium]